MLWCDVNSNDEMVHTNISFFAVSRPKQVNAQDALKGTSFDVVDDMLLRLHYIYIRNAGS